MQRCHRARAGVTRPQPNHQENWKIQAASWVLLASAPRGHVAPRQLTLKLDPSRPFWRILGQSQPAVGAV